MATGKTEFERAAHTVMDMLMFLYRFELLHQKDMVDNVDAFSASRYVRSYAKAFEVSTVDSKAAEQPRLPDDSV